LYIIYVDESGTPDMGSGTAHFAVVGLAIPIGSWKERDSLVRAVLAAARLPNAELHTAWMARRYPEQERIPDFRAASDPERRRLVTIERKKDLAKASLRGDRAVKALRRNYKHSDAYVHLTFDERMLAVRAIADVLASWDSAKLFGDVHRKADLTPPVLLKSREMALEQVTTRFNTFLSKSAPPGAMGIVVHDQHQAESLNLTDLFRQWHQSGTKYTGIPRIAETPLFVDSSLTLMVQLADLSAYATRRFFDNNETDLFDRIYPRFDRKPDGTLVGLRHFTGKRPCVCRVCIDHRRDAATPEP